MRSGGTGCRWRRVTGRAVFGPRGLLCCGLLRSRTSKSPRLVGDDESPLRVSVNDETAPARDVVVAPAPVGLPHRNDRVQDVLDVRPPRRRHGPDRSRTGLPRSVAPPLLVRDGLGEIEQSAGRASALAQPRRRDRHRHRFHELRPRVAPRWRLRARAAEEMAESGRRERLLDTPAHELLAHGRRRRFIPARAGNTSVALRMAT